MAITIAAIKESEDYSPLEQINDRLAQLASAINAVDAMTAYIDQRQAIVRKGVPLASDDVQKGCLVYFDSASGYFAPAQALLLGDPGAHGQSVEAECARVEGMVIGKETTSGSNNNVQGTLLLGGYWEDSDAATACLGPNASPGVYYLSPTTAGKAVKAVDTKDRLQQGVLTYYGDGKFSLSLHYMAHDSHFHTSAKLVSEGWKEVTAYEEGGYAAGATKPGTHWYDFSDQEISRGDLVGNLSDTVAVLFDAEGKLVLDTRYFFDRGYLWYNGTHTEDNTTTIVPPAAPLVLFMNHPFAYGFPVVHDIEAAEGGSVTVTNTRGYVRIKAADFVDGDTEPSATAVSGIVGQSVNRTPVVSGLTAAPGISITPGLAGNYMIGLSSMVGSYLDATAINHNGTLMTETQQGILHLNFPAGRDCSAVVSLPINEIPSVSEEYSLKAKLWIQALGAAGTFSVLYSFIPATAGAAVESSESESTLSATSSTGYNIIVEGTGMSLSSPGLLSAKISRASSIDTAADILRIGFILSVESTATSQE